MKTIMIWDQCGEKPITYFILSGDYRHLDNVYINRADGRQDLQDELTALIFDDEGKEQLKARRTFPYKTVGNGAKVIVAGFMP